MSNFAPRPRIRGFTLIELAIVVGLIAILIAIAVPQFLKSAETSRRAACHANLRQLDDAKQQYCIEHRLNDGDAVAYDQLYPGYIKTPRILACPSGGDYVLGAIGETPLCSEHGGPYGSVSP